ASVLSLFQNLLGLAVGPLIAGVLSDLWTLENALMAMPVFGLLAAWAFMVASRSYGADLQSAGESADDDLHAAPAGAPRSMPA
ncbi:MAG TPA: MFS transporter, partial [Variovorax sp.]|nr:MFS transporter [Variovorax sp.]